MQQDNLGELLDRGFAFLEIDIAREFHDQINDVNHEPGCMGTLGSAFASTESHVFEIGEEDKGLTISFNSKERNVEINGRKPTRFYYLVQVRPSPDGMTWGYAGVRTMHTLLLLAVNSIRSSKKQCSHCSALKLSYRVIHSES